MAGVRAVMSVLGTRGYIEYLAGGLPLIISVPHGGCLKPEHIPDRKGRCLPSCISSQNFDPTRKCSCNISVKKDVYTRELADLVSSELATLTGLRPFVVINHLYRGKMDANRDLEEATLLNEDAVTAFHEFHGFISLARQSVEERYGRGLYVDLHGHSHENGWVELGYLLTEQFLKSEPKLERSKSSKSNLGSEKCRKGRRATVAGPVSCSRSSGSRRASDAGPVTGGSGSRGRNSSETSEPDADSNNTSIRSLAVASGLSLEELVRGQSSLGAILESQGLKTVPSPKHFGPGSSGQYYYGGYNTTRHGSLNCGTIDAIQVEVPRQFRSERKGPAFARKLAWAFLRFLITHYNFRNPKSSRTRKSSDS